MRYLLLVLLFLMVSCGEPQPYIKGKDHHRLNEINYIKDTRTNLCFAVSHFASSRSISNVPCEAVEKLIENNEAWSETKDIS